MIQFKILSGKQAGSLWVARRFPVRIGRAAGADLRIEEDGVWDQHVSVHLQPSEGWLLKTQGEAIASVNGEPAREALLRSGDCIQMGGVDIQFWLSEGRQRALWFREYVTWLTIIAVGVCQVLLVYWLLRLQ